jgi:hypothetical protein
LAQSASITRALLPDQARATDRFATPDHGWTDVCGA